MKIAIKLLKMVAYAAGGVLLFVLLALLFIQTGFFKEHAKTIAIDQVRKNTGATLRLGRIEGNFITRITLVDVALEVDNKPFASAERIRVSYFLPALLHRTIVAYKVHIEGLKGCLLKDEDGKWNFNKLGPPGRLPGKRGTKKPGGALPSLFARNVTIEGSSIVMEDAVNEGSKRSVEGLNISASFSMFTRRKKNTFTLSLNGLQFKSTNPSLTMVNLRGAASLSGGNAVFDNLTIELPGSKGRVHGTLAGISSPVYDLRADFPQVAMADLRSLLPGITLDGELATYLLLKGPTNALRVSHRLRYRKLHMQTDALLNGKENILSLRSAIRDFRPQDILPSCGIGVLPEKCLTGTINLDLVVDAQGGKNKQLAANARLELLPSVINTTAISDATINVSLNGERLSVSSSTIETSSGIFTLAGGGEVLGFLMPHEPIDARFQIGLGQVNIAAFLPHTAFYSDISGIVRATFTKPAKAPLHAMVVNGTIAVSSASVHGVSVHDADIRAEYDNGAITIDHCRIRLDAGDIIVSGSIDPKTSLDVRYHVTAEDIGAISKLVPGFDGAGRLEIAGDLRGTVRKPVLSASLQGKELRYAQVAAGSLSSDITIQKAGKYPVGTVSLDVRDFILSGLAMQHVHLAADSSGDAIAARATIERDNARQYAFAGTLSGLDSAALTARLDMFQAAADSVSWHSTAPIEARLSKQGIDIISFDVANGDQHIALAGRIAAAGPLDFTMNISSADVADIGRIAGIPAPVGGMLSCDLYLAGDPLAPVATGFIALRQGTTDGVAFDAMVAELRYGDGRVDFDLALDNDRKRLLAVAGTVPVDLALKRTKKRFQSSGLAVTVRGRNLPAALLSAFIKEVEKTGGDISLDLFLTGDPLRPTARGRLTIDNAFLRLSPLGTDYTDINGRINIDSGTVTVERLSLRSGNGIANLKGSLLFIDYLPAGADMTLSCRRFRVMDSNLFSGVIDADLLLSGPAKRSSLTGNVTVLESIINIPTDTQKQVQEIEIVGTGGASGSTARVVENTGKRMPLIDNVIINTDITIPGNTWVKGRGVNAELSGKLTFRKDQGKSPFIIGRIETVRGTYVLRGRTLRLDRGIIAFTGARRLNADLDIMASGQVSDVTVIVLVGGTLEKPELSLRSQPPMDESDILAYLIFGKPTSRLTQTEGRIIQSTAVQVIGTIAARGVKEVLGRQLAPDVFDIVSTGTESGFGVGKYLTDKLFVRYEWRQGIDEVAQTIIDYQISRYFSLHSQVGYAPTAGVDLFWTIHY